MMRFAYLVGAAGAAVFGTIVNSGSALALQSNAEPFHFLCISQDTEAGVAYGSGVITETLTRKEADARFAEINGRWAEHTQKSGQWRDGPMSFCKVYRQSNLPRDRYQREAFQQYQVGSGYELIGGKWIRVVQADLPKDWADKPASKTSAAKKREPRKSQSGQADQASAQPQQDKVGKTKADYEAEYQAKLSAHKAEVAEFERKKREREEEIARQNAVHVAAQEAAARETAAYEEKLAAHRRELDEANRRQQAYFEAQRRHALCVNGDRKWCDNGAAAETKMPDAGKASTDTDAMRCVTNPEVFPSRVQKNTIEARVINNCETSVDIVICLNRPEGWHCGVRMGVSPGGSMSWDARNGNGQVYWDARVMGKTKPLGRPN